MLLQSTREIRALKVEGGLAFEKPRRSVELLPDTQRQAQRWPQRSVLGTARLLAKAAGSVAREQTVSAALTFCSKSIRDPGALADWIEFIISHHREHGALPPNARVLRKPQRNCGVIGRNVRNRVRALVSHYNFAALHFDDDVHRTLLDLGQVPLAKIEARDKSFGLWLGSSLPFGQKQEGELTVWLTDSAGLSLARMAFTFDVDPNGKPSLLIGGLQGLPAQFNKKLIVAATRTLSGLRPKDAVLVGVQAVARALGIQHVSAVSNANHVLAAEWFMSDSVISRDYDGFWQERGGVPEAAVGFALPLPDYTGRVAANSNARNIDRYRAALTEQVLTVLVPR